MSNKQGKIPKGIQTSESLTTVEQSTNPNKKLPSGNDFINAITSLDPKALPEVPEGSERFLFDTSQNNELPRNVYIETVITSSGKPKKMLWWHCENGNYIGRKEVIRINPRTEEKHLRGYDFNIEATPANIAKVVKLATARTKFYKKYLQEVNGIHDIKDFHA